jgi:uncharacterized protein YbaR (Trm112 family)
MKESILEIIVCPICKISLELRDAVRDGNEITGGNLFCTKCQHSYPIVDGIPNLLPPDIDK